MKRGYKDSGIDWLGEIPDNWNVNNLKRLCSLIKDGTHGSFKRVDDGFPLLSVRNIINSSFTMLEDDSMISKEDYLSIVKSFKIKENDIQLAIVGATMGKVAIVPKMPPFATQRSLSTIRTIKKLLFNKYLFYYIQSPKIQGFLWANTSYSAQPGIYLNTIQEISAPIPPYDEQIFIAKFLDSKTTAIDRKITLLEQKTTHYQQLRRSLINKTVCRGLNKNVKLKDSGIEWLGMIPEHWEVKRGKDLFQEKSKKGYPNEPLLAASQKMGVVLKSMLEQRSMEAQKDFENFKLVQISDFVISLRSFEGGIETSYYKGIISPVYSVFATIKDLNNGYFKHLFKSSIFILYLQSIITGIRDGQSIKFVEIQNTFFPIPTINEQYSIAEYLDEKTQKIDNILSNIITQIETLKELRKTLINDVVTGKIKVAEYEYTK